MAETFMMRNSFQETVRNMLGYEAVVALLIAIFTLPFLLSRSIQKSDYQRWEYAATNTIPELLRQNSISEASLKLDEITREITDYKTGRLQAGSHIPAEKLAALESRLDWQSLSKNYLTNVSPEIEFYQMWRTQEQLLRAKKTKSH
jgi:hypothetical protein